MAFKQSLVSMNLILYEVCTTVNTPILCVRQANKRNRREMNVNVTTFKLQCCTCIMVYNLTNDIINILTESLKHVPTNF